MPKALLAAAAIALAACRQDMHDQPRYKPLQSSPLFADSRSSRPAIEGTVARGQLKADSEYFLGRRTASPAPAPVKTTTPGVPTTVPAAVDPNLVQDFPVVVTRAMIERGQQRYQIFCTPCHGYTGTGRGMIVQRGLSQPPSLHIDRLKEAPVGHMFDVITNGYGAMYSYSQRIPIADRWAIISYIRVLQASRTGGIDDVPEAERSTLSGGAQ